MVAEFLDLRLQTNHQLVLLTIQREFLSLNR